MSNDKTKNKFNEKQLSFIAGGLAQTYKDGIPIIMGLELVLDTVSSKFYKESLIQILKYLKEGKSLSDGFAEFKHLYPEFFVGIITIGENTGRLYEVLMGLNTFYDKLMYIKKEIKNASYYPLFIFISILILSFFLLNNVMPNFCEIYKSMRIELPSNCKWLYDISVSLKSDPIKAIITIACWLLIIYILFKYYYQKIDIGKFTKIKVVKLFFEYMMVLVFSIITSTGINISQALEYCECSMSFNYLKNKIREINMCIIKGNTLTESLEKSNVFSKHTLAIIKIREETGSIEDGFKMLSKKLEDTLYGEIKKYLKLINPVFIVLMAAFILVFVLGFVIPLFDKLQSGISGMR